MDIQQVARYLHMDQRDVTKLASRGQIPCRKTRGQFIFRRGDVEHWIEQRMGGLGGDRLAGIERGVSAHHGFEAGQLLICPLIPPGGIAVPLPARTRDSVIRRLVALADDARLVFDRDELIAEIRKREELCSTSLLPGVAIPHPRHPLPYDIAGSFLVAAVTTSGIPYGADDGSLTRLFFLVCCKDERTHFHVLARLAQMLYRPGAMEQLLACENTEDMHKILLQLENAVLSEA